MPSSLLRQLLCHHRKKAGLSQAKLAAKMGYADSSLLSRFEQGKRLPSREHLELFITALQLSGEESQQLWLAYLSTLARTNQPPQADVLASLSSPPLTSLDPLTWAQLRDLCAEITRRRLLAAARHKYQSDLYLQRSQARRAFEQFLGSEQRCFALIGPSGVGKSNFMLALAEELRTGSDHCTLMYDTASLPVKPALTEIMGRDFKERLAAATWPAAEGWAKLAEVIGQSKSLFILGVDALNEHPHPRELLRQLDELAQAAPPRLKIIFTVRPESWQALRRSLSLAETLYYHEAEGEPGGVVLEPFSRQELSQAYLKYQQLFDLRTGYEALSNEVQQTLRDPLEPAAGGDDLPAADHPLRADSGRASRAVFPGALPERAFAEKRFTPRRTAAYAGDD